MKLQLLAAIMSATALATGAQTTQKLTANKASEYGLIYSLPSTVLDVTVEAERVVRKPGEFYKYAKKYLATDRAIASPSEEWSLKSVTVVPRGVAGAADDRYLMQFKSGSSPFLIINSEGLPVALNTETLPAEVMVELPVPVEAQPTPLDVPAARQAMTEEMLQSQSTAKRAELAAAQIYALRQSRNDYITGQADNMPDGDALRLILDNLTAQEAALTAMFLGTEQRSTDVATFTYTPDGDAVNDVVARLSSFKGIVDPDDLSGDPIYLTLDVTGRGELPVNEKGEEKKFPKGGVAYRIPGTADITLTFDGRKIYSGSVQIAQFGVVFGIDPSLFTDKKAPAYLLLDPTTGAIRELGTVKQ